MESYDRDANKSEFETPIESPEFLKTIRHGQELIHQLYQSERSDSVEYKQLSSLLISPDGKSWKTYHEIPEGLLLGTLDAIKNQETHSEETPQAIDDEFAEIPDPHESEEPNDAEDFLKKYDIGMLDRSMPIPRTPEERTDAIEKLRALDPLAPIKMFHGLNGSLDKALDVISSPAAGVEQRSGPTLSLWPVMQFWKPGDAGLEYEIKRSQVQFPGENNPAAVAEIRPDGVIYLINGHSSLPFHQFDVRVLYTDIPGEDTDPGFDTWGIELPRWTGYRPLSEANMENAVKISKLLSRN